MKRFQFSRPFWFLVTGSFINRAGNFVLPFFALYLTSRRHLSMSEATLIISLMGLGSLAAGVGGGMLADVLGRRVTILVSLLTSAVLMLALGFAPNISLIVVLAILYKLLSDLAGPAISAAIADMTPRDKLAQAYSLPYWANNLGSAIGPILAGVLDHSHRTYLYKKMIKHAQKDYLVYPEEQPKHHGSHQGQSCD